MTLGRMQYELEIDRNGDVLAEAPLEDVEHYFVYEADRHAELLLG
jgi:hypothetical protein